MKSNIVRCCYCGAAIYDGGNSAYDNLHKETRDKVCCDTCNSLITVPMRNISFYLKNPRELNRIEYCIVELQDFVKERKEHERSDMSQM